MEKKYRNTGRNEEWCNDYFCKYEQQVMQSTKQDGVKQYSEMKVNV